MVYLIVLKEIMSNQLLTIIKILPIIDEHFCDLFICSCLARKKLLFNQINATLTID